MPQFPTCVLVAVSVKIALSGPENGNPDTPEKEKLTDPDAVTVVVVPVVETVHCCSAPFCWTYCANVTGTAEAVPVVNTTIEYATKPPSTSRFVRPDFIVGDACLLVESPNGRYFGIIVPDMNEVWEGSRFMVEDRRRGCDGLRKLSSGKHPGQRRKILMGLESATQFPDPYPKHTTISSYWLS